MASPYPGFPRSNVPAWMHRVSVVRVIAGSVILQVYVAYTPRPMRAAPAPTYNAAMVAVTPLWHRLTHMNPFLVDGALAAVLAALLFTQAGLEFFPLVVLATVPLIWRRNQPLLVFCLVFVGVIGLAHDTPWPAISCIAVAAYSVGAYDPYRLVSLGALLATGVFIDYEFGGGLPTIPNAMGPFLVLLPLWLVGKAIRSWRRQVTVLKEHAVLDEASRQRRMQDALIEERARIARELHDVVAHSVSVMVVQAGAARQILNSSPERATEALLAVESTGRTAMTELRSMLGLLDDGDLALAPQPGLDQIQPLVQRVVDAGLPVDLKITGDPRPLAVGIDITAYRIVQEALTNSLKYSDLAPTEVVLEYRESELKVQVLDDGASALSRNSGDAGRGLIGMRERVALYGGSLEA